MAKAMYVLCLFTSVTCALWLFRLFWQHRGRVTRLALWSAVAFAWLAINNALVFVDLVVLPTRQPAVARAATACLGGGLLLVGLIWETE